MIFSNTYLQFFLHLQNLPLFAPRPVSLSIRFSFFTSIGGSGWKFCSSGYYGKSTILYFNKRKKLFFQNITLEETTTSQSLAFKILYLCCCSRNKLVQSRPWSLRCCTATAYYQQQDPHHYPKNFSLKIESFLLLFFAYIQIK